VGLPPAMLFTFISGEAARSLGRIVAQGFGKRKPSAGEDGLG